MMISASVSGWTDCGRMVWLTVDSAHDKPYLCCVSGACEMGVDLLGLCLVQRYKPVENVVACSGVIGATLRRVSSSTFGNHERVRTIIVWEVILHRANRQLLFESIDLVQEQDDAGLDKPS